MPDGKARLFPLAMSVPTDPPDEEFDLHLNNGRILEHFHEGNLTYRSNGIRENVSSSPLPKVNSRFHHPTPQRGVEVERKWKRVDYEMPHE